MQNYPVNYAQQPTYQQVPQPVQRYAMQQPVASPQQVTYSYAPQQVQTQVQPYTQTPQMGNNGAVLNIGTNTPGSIPLNGASGVTINIMGATVNPNGANINNTYNATGQPGQAYDKTYYTQQPSVPIGASNLAEAPKTNDTKGAKKNIVLLTDEYIKTLENYIRNDNPDIKLMGAKELMNRFKEDESRKNDPALTALLNLTLQSKYSNVKMIGMGILQNGWAQGDALTQQLLGQIQQDKSGYGLDALDAAKAALKSAGQVIQVNDPNPPKTKDTKK